MRMTAILGGVPTERGRVVCLTPSIEQRLFDRLEKTRLWIAPPGWDI
jgi:hypothetical protein